MALLLVLVSFLCWPCGATEPARPEAAQAVNIIWLSPADGAGADQISALKPSDSKVFAAATGLSPTGSEAFVARAYVGASGDPKWIQQFDLGTGRNTASAVDTDGNRVFAVGRGEDAGGDSMFLVRAFDAKTGAPLWDDTYGHGGDFNSANDVACKGSRLFAVGTGRTGSGADEMVVRAYVAKTGELAWADAFSRGGGDSDGNAVAVNRSGVFVAGYTETAVQERMWAVRAYNQVNGSVLWTDLYSSGGRDIYAEHIAASDNLVAVAGMQFSADWKASYVLRVYDANTGQVRWTQGEPSFGTSSCGLAVKGTNVYLIGVEPGKFFVKAFNGKTGALKWQDSFDNLGEMDFDADVDASADYVSVVAYSQSVTPSLDYAWAMTVRIYKAGSGALAQEQRRVGTGKNSEVDIALKGNKVYVVGEGVDDPAVKCATEGSPEDTTVTIEGRTIKVNGQVFFVKGMNYAPSPIGSKDEWPPHLDWFYTTPKSGHGWSKIWERDFPYLTDMGVNVIKVYSWQACVPEHPEWEPFDHGDFLKKLKDNNIYIIPQVYSPSLTQLNDLDQANWRNDPVAKWTIQVMAEIKNSPYKSQVIGYQAGNELNNGGYFTDKFWDNYNFMCGKVKEMAEGKPVMIGVVDDSMQTANKWFAKMTNVDIWGINSYRAQIGSPDPFGPPAAGFTNLFTTWASASSSSPKPMIITETGPPASMRKDSAPCTDQSKVDILPDNAKAQADYYEVLWNRGNAATYDDLVRNSPVCSKSQCNGAPCTNCQAATCSGAFLFEWTDEWWKYKTGNPALHEASKEKGDAFPGKCGDEEYFGIFDVSVNGRPPETPDEGKADNVAARAAVARIKTLLAATNP